MKLYSVSDDVFAAWVIDPRTTPADLTEAVAVLQAKKNLLWMSGSTDSYHRDRFDRDACYTSRIAACVKALAKKGHKVGV